MPISVGPYWHRKSTNETFRAAKPAKCVVKFLVKSDLEVDLKLEISDGKKLVKFGGRTFLPAWKAQEISGLISGQILEKISETSFQVSRLFSEASFSRRAVLRNINNPHRKARTMATTHIVVINETLRCDTQTSAPCALSTGSTQRNPNEVQTMTCPIRIECHDLRPPSHAFPLGMRSHEPLAAKPRTLE